MILTPRAEELLAPLAAILGEIDRTLTASEIFNPATVDRTMRIATNDYGAFILIPPLMQRLELIAPNINIEVWEIGRDAIAALKEGKIDLAICDGWTLKQCQCTEVLFASRIAHQLATSYGLQILSPPIDVGNFQVAMAWRSALTNDPAIQWLRGELRSISSKATVTDNA